MKLNKIIINKKSQGCALSMCIARQTDDHLLNRFRAIIHTSPKRRSEFTHQYIRLSYNTCIRFDFLAVALVTDRLVYPSKGDETRV